MGIKAASSIQWASWIEYNSNRTTENFTVNCNSRGNNYFNLEIKINKITKMFKISASRNNFEWLHNNINHNYNFLTSTKSYHYFLPLPWYILFTDNKSSNDSKQKMWLAVTWGNHIIIFIVLFSFSCHVVQTFHLRTLSSSISFSPSTKKSMSNSRFS